MDGPQDFAPSLLRCRDEDVIHLDALWQMFCVDLKRYYRVGRIGHRRLEFVSPRWSFFTMAVHCK